MAERAEELERTIAGYVATDAGVEDYHYEEILKYAETVTGVAMPKKMAQLLENLRKSGDGLRKLAEVRIKSPALLSKLEQLQSLHDRYFEEVQAVAIETLEHLKKKFRGEADEFEQRLVLLSDSPLVRGIEYDKDSPERRIEGFKQEIIELLMRPLAKTRLELFEKRLTDVAKRSEAFELEIAPNSKSFGQHSYGQNVAERHQPKNYPTGLKIENGYPMLPFDQLRAGFRREIENTEKILQRDKLAFEVNRSVIEMVLEGANDEAELMQAFQELEKYIQAARDWARHDPGEGIPWKAEADKYTYVPLPNSNLAKSVLGHFQLFAVPVSEAREDRPGFQSATLAESLSVSEQLLGRSLKEYENRARRNGTLPLAQYLARQGRRAFLEAMNVQGTNEEIGWMSARAEDESHDPIVPDHEGSGRVLKLRPAFTRIDHGNEGKAKDPLAALPRKLSETGWTISKLGAFIEPQQDPRLVDREYALTLERLSKPQIEPERAFDVRSPEGDFHVYTTDQAVDLLRRARRDARELLEETEQAVAGELGFSTSPRPEVRSRGTEALVGKIRAREQELAAAHAEALRKKDAELAAIREELEREQSASVRKDGKLERMAASDREYRGETKAKLEAIQASLKSALALKSGLLGGEKELRAAIEKLVRELGSNE